MEQFDNKRVHIYILIIVALKKKTVFPTVQFIKRFTKISICRVQLETDNRSDPLCMFRF